MKKISFNKENYILIIAGIVTVVLGFALMSGGGSVDPSKFNKQELFSFRRITLAPMMVILGYLIVLYGVMKRNKGYFNFFKGQQEEAIESEK